MFNKRVTSILLAFCMLMSAFAATTSVAAPMENAELCAQSDVAKVGADYGLADNVQDGVILHCWNWSYNNIKNNMANIAAQGFTSLQVSPVQTPKEGISGRSMESAWWVLYQPAALSMNNEGGKSLGTKAEFKAMCDEAHKYGIFVIVDIVANHLGNRSDAGNVCDAAWSYENQICSSWLFHNAGGANDNSAYDVTKGHIGMPDLQTENSHVQQRVLSLLKECIDCGADGFRFDAAKHIETPDDGDQGSQFWPTVINGATAYGNSKGKTIYYYGEILNTCGGGRSYDSYTRYMSITDNTTGNNIRNAVAGGNASGAASSNYNSGQSADKIVLWAESHDTYANSERESTYVSVENLNKTWALVASRKGSTALYFARPQNFSTTMGNADKTGWSYKEVQAVNKFHNYFVGASEYLGSCGSFAYVRRGDSGVVIVNVNGASASVNINVNGMKDGTYKDAISGNTFTVSGGNVSGQMGNTGIAVVYNESTSPAVSISQKGGTFKTDTLSLTLSLSNATSGTYSINGGKATTFTGTKTITIGSGVSYGSSITVKLTATDGKTTVSETYTFNKVARSATGIYFDNSGKNWFRVYCYIYAEDNYCEWPGCEMTNEGGGIWFFEVPAGFENCKVLFTDNNGNQVPSASEPGFDYSDSAMIYQSGSWKEYSITPPFTEEKTETTQTPVTKPVTIPTETTSDNITGKYLFGDVDFNSVINIKDATLIQKFCADLSDLTTLAQKVAKVCGNSQVTVKDATAIQKYVAGLLSVFDSGKWYGEASATPEVIPTEPEVTPTQPAVTPTQATEPEAEKTQRTVYFSNTSGWGSVTAHYWSTTTSDTTSWPGKTMTYVSDGIYKIVLDNKYDMIIFSNNGSGQTADLSIPGDGYLFNYSSGQWSKYYGGSSSDTPATGKICIKFIDTNGWGSAKVICWEDSNAQSRDEIQMSSLGNNTYEVYIDSKYDKLYFTNGSQKSQDFNVPENGGTYVYNQGWQ